MAVVVKFKPDHKMESGAHGHGGSTPQYVVIDGERVGVVRKRSEWFGNLGHKGVRYHYFDFFRLDEHGRMVYEESVIDMRDGTQRVDRKPLASNSTRKHAVSRALVALGKFEAAYKLDSDTAPHWITQEGRCGRAYTDDAGVVRVCTRERHDDDAHDGFDVVEARS